MRELEVPPAALKDPKATEMLRLWAAGGKEHVTINIGCYHERGIDERHAWGIIIADFVQHIANALNKRYQIPFDESVREIRKAIDVELANPDGDVQGE